MTTTKHNVDAAFEARTKADFDAGVEGLDAATRARLARARNRALVEVERRSFIPAWVLEHARAAAAVAIVAVIAGWLLVRVESSSQPGLQTMTEVTDLELLLEPDELEMFEDLEFYAWLDEQSEAQAPAADPDDGAG